MTDLFLSYASEDRESAKALVREFESQGWTVWWDRLIEVGSSFDKSIEDAIDSALCIVVIWSNSSIGSDWVRAEASEGLARNILVPILLDDVKPPLLFRQKQAISLLEWKRGKADIPLANIVPSIASILERYHESSIPVSTQRSWLLGSTRSNGEEVLAKSTYMALNLALSYFDNLFLYPADYQGESTHALSTGKMKELISEEGLDGYLFGEIKIEEEIVHFTLHVIHGETETSYSVITVDHKLLPAVVGKCLLQAAYILQGEEPAEANRMLEYLRERNTESLYHFWLSVQYADLNDYTKVKETCLEIIRLDEDFLQAHLSLARAYYHLGQPVESNKLIAKRIINTQLESKINALRARAVYYVVHSEDWYRAASEFEAILQISPMDEAALVNLAVCNFYLLNFDRAIELSRRAIALYPSNTIARQNLAFYSLHAGAFENAEVDAKRIFSENSAYINMQVIRALVSAHSGDERAADILYLDGMNISERTDAILLQARADLAMAHLDWQHANALLQQGIEIDKRLGNQEGAARKTLMKAEVSLFDQNNIVDATRHIHNALADSASVATLAFAALLSAIFDIQPSRELEDLLKKRTSNHGKAYRSMVSGLNELYAGEFGTAIHFHQEALKIADLWLIRFCLAHTYKRAGLLLEAADEISICNTRPGEALSAALDEQPTYRYFTLARDF
jgi:tetratricopeptide (TPR) repeat protein